jgi:hypothetical protein
VSLSVRARERFVSTNEHLAFGISAVKKKKIEESFGAMNGDVIIFNVDMHEKAEKAIKVVEEEVEVIKV